MDGLARVAGVLERTITIGGKTYTLSTPTLAAWAALENELIRERQRVLETAVQVAAKLPRDQLPIFWEQAHRVASQGCAVPVSELDRLPVFDQMAVVWYLGLHRHHRHEFPTLASVREFLLTHLGDQTPQAISELVAHIVEGGLKNSGGPAADRSTPG